MPPSSDSSPSSRTSSTSRRAMSPDAASTPSAIGRSNEEPALRMSAGARLTVMRSIGNSNPELRIALRTRSRLSRTLASGRPTMLNAGRPNDTSTSTCTGQASIPNTAAVRTHASTHVHVQTTSQHKSLAIQLGARERSQQQPPKHAANVAVKSHEKGRRGIAHEKGRKGEEPLLLGITQENVDLGEKNQENLPFSRSLV